MVCICVVDKEVVVLRRGECRERWRELMKKNVLSCLEDERERVWRERSFSSQSQTNIHSRFGSINIEYHRCFPIHNVLYVIVSLLQSHATPQEISPSEYSQMVGLLQSSPVKLLLQSHLKLSLSYIQQFVFNDKDSLQLACAAVPSCRKRCV